jgi:hypothetical protein
MMGGATTDGARTTGGGGAAATAVRIASNGIMAISSFPGCMNAPGTVADDR